MRKSGFSSIAAVVIAISCLSIYGIAHAQVFSFPKAEFPLTDVENRSVDMSEILSGGPPRDGIPAIDEPKFIAADAAAQWLDDREPVLAVLHNGDVKAYPLQILMYHEIVNDEIGGDPVTITFCPLCNASVVFDRRVNNNGEDVVLDFGTTGRLRNSDLVMYDRQSESWWQQFTGSGIIGEYNEVKLDRLPSQIVSFRKLRQEMPEAQILSRETGYERSYGKNPYRGYDSIDNNPFLFKGTVDPRLPAMERVLSIRLGGPTRLIPLSPLTILPVINLTIEETPVTVFAASSAASALDEESIADSRAVPAAVAFEAQIDGQALSFNLEDGAIVDDQSGSHWNIFGMSTGGKWKGRQLAQIDEGVSFAFTWLAFDPDAIVLEVE